MNTKQTTRQISGTKQLQRVSSKFQQMLEQKADELPDLGENQIAQEFLAAKQAQYASNLGRLERQLTEYQTERERHLEELERLRRRCAEGSKTVSGSSGEVSAEMKKLRVELQNLQAVDKENLARLQEKEERVARLQGQVDEYNKERGQFISQEELQAYRTAEEEKRRQLQDVLQQKDAAVVGLETKLREAQEDAQRQAREFAEQHGRMRSEAAVAQEEKAALQSSLQEMAENVGKLMATIRELEYQIQDLKGKIRIAVRFRPVKTPMCAEFPDEASYGKQLVYKTEGVKDVTGKENNRPVPLQFDRVFGFQASQETVFSEVEPLVRQVYDGYKTCIFAYGQSGSGKTHTQYGSDSAPGVMPRALEYLLAMCQERPEENCSLRVSFYEIYNDKLYDLLGDFSSRPQENLLSSAVEQKVQKKEEPYSPVQRRVSITAERVQVVDLATVQIRTMEEAMELIKVSQARRKTSATVLNDVSSRSHAIFTISFTREKVNGALTIVDLAGSEQLSGDDSTSPARRDESVFINKSLSSLSNVFCALRAGAQHVPFRDSTLTKVLQEYFSGQNKVVMIACVNSDIACYQETVNTLNFAQRLRTV